MSDPFKLEDRLAAIEKRLDVLEEYAGLNEWDAESTGTPLHRRLDYLEDWRRDQIT
jgi:hypothetical protein